MAWTKPRTAAVIGVGVLLLALGILYLLSLALVPKPPVISIGPNRVKPQIAVAPSRNVLLLAADGSLWRWGNGAKPHPCDIGSDWKAIAMGWTNFAVLKTNGTLWQCDFVKSKTDESPVQAVPRQISPSGNWRAVVADFEHFAALKSDGTLWTWPGDGSPAQLGPGTNWIGLAGSGRHFAALRADGTLWVWGSFFPLLKDSFKSPISLTQFGGETNWVAVYVGT